MHSRLLFGLFVTAIPLAGQQVREGYAQPLQQLPPGATNPLLLHDRDAVVYFTGTDLVLENAGQARVILTFPAPVFGSFTLRIAGDEVLFGENSGGEVWRVPLHQGAPRLVAVVPFNYDAIHYSPNLVLLSAKTGGLGATDNDIVAVDLHGGTVTPLARVAGASGPLVGDAAGNLYYAAGASSFPPPPGGTAIVRWPATRVLAGLGTTLLTVAEARTVFTGLDAAGDLALDSDGDLLFVDWWNGTVGEINDVNGGAPWASVLVDYAGAPVTAAGLQFIAGANAGPRTFEPFQPPGGGVLAVHESTFGATSQLRLLEALRPRTEPSPPGTIPPGPFTVATIDGPANGAGVLAIHLLAANRETRLQLPGFEQGLWWDLAMFGALSTHPVSFDGNGRAALALSNPGGIGGVGIAVQVAFVDAAARTLGSAAAHHLLLL